MPPEGGGNMRIAGLIIGVFGAISAFGGAIFVLFISGVAEVLGAEGADQLAIGGVIALIMSIVALVGAVLSMAKPRLAVALMIVAAIVGLIAVFAAFIPATVLLFIASGLTFFGRKEGKRSARSAGSV
jgi:hypothetical protein